MEHTLYPDCNRRNDYLGDLITQGTLHNGQNVILNAIADEGRDSVKATHDGAIAAVSASDRNGIAAIKETSDASRDNIRETSRAGSDAIRETSRVGADLANAISDTRSSIERTSLESRLAFQIGLSGVSKDIHDTTRDVLMSVKDNGYAIREEGCKTREAVFTDGARTREKLCEVEHNLEKEILKGFHTTQLEALKNKCELDAKILAESCATRALISECCCEAKEDAAATRALILSENARAIEKAQDQRINNLELRLLLKENSPGNSGK